MLAELRKKSQITLPKNLVTKLGLNEGDILEITEKDGIINIVPVAVYPKKYVEELKEEIASIKKKIETGEKPLFGSVDELFDYLDAD